MLKPPVATKAASPKPDSLGQARDRMAAVIAAATAPAECGPRIIPAPGRGPTRVVPQVDLYPDGRDGWAPRNAGWAGCSPVRAADVFDRMLRAAAEGKEPFTEGQVAMARRYRALVERHDAGGVRCSDLVGQQGGGAGGDFMDAYLAEGRELDAIRRRIGAGSAMTLRRIRPSARGSRRSIPDRAVVDMVCLGDATLSQVLRRHGWQVDGHHRKALSVALSAALDRMIGYRGEKTS